MSVYFNCFPSEILKSFFEFFYLKYILTSSHSLTFIFIDYKGQIIDLSVPGKHYSFPNTSLITFTIA